MKIYHIVSRREPEPEPEPEPEYDIDVCTCCGRYFAWTEQHAELCQEKGFPLNTQFCLRCIRSE